METRDFFVQKAIKLSELGEAKNYVYSNELIDLIKDKKIKEYIVSKYGLGEELKIECDKIDKLLARVKMYVDRFNSFRVKAAGNTVTTSFLGNKEKDVQFTIREGEIDETEADEIKAIAVYDSVSMFYNNRKLTQYINYLRNIVGSEKLLTAVNNSWNEHYEDKKAEVRFFRMLEDRVDGDYYLKSINSEKYNEYGIAETFVVTMLELNEIKKENKDTTFFISSIALSESRIEIILSNSEATKIEDLGYVYPSIAIRNGDQGKNSFGFYSSLEFKLASRDKDGIIHFFPNKDAKDIKTKITFRHTVSVETFVDSYESIQNFFDDADKFKDDYFFLKQAKTPDVLRAKIEHRLESNNSPFKGVKELRDLFKREKAGHINNLAKLLQLCGKAEMIDIDHELKFRLRYLISNVLLYGNNELE